MNTGVGCHSLLQGIFLIQGSDPGLLHCRQILYSLSHQGSPGSNNLSGWNEELPSQISELPSDGPKRVDFFFQTRGECF